MIQLARLCACLAPLACSAAQPNAAPQTTPVAQSSEQETTPPSLPSVSLAVPAGNQLAFHLQASGVQIYACQSVPAGFSWSLQAPEASLVDSQGRVIVRHFAGPTWESVDDGSKVAATKVEAFPDKPDAIPSLLLKASAHDGQGRMADVSYIQRLETSAGLAPSSGCDAEHAGAVSRAPYTASYYFYRPAASP
jgi:hypothetical protein